MVPAHALTFDVLGKTVHIPSTDEEQHHFLVTGLLLYPDAVVIRTGDKDNGHFVHVEPDCPVHVL